MTNKQQNRAELRRHLREKRNRLTPQQQTQASKQLSQQLLALTQPGQSLALYLGNDGELSPNYAIDELLAQHRNVYLPVMHGFRKGYLNFQQYEPLEQMTTNNFGILEPKLNSLTTQAMTDLDFIFMPLVGFDQFGNRLGMGGGFYDRTLSKIHLKKQRPKLIGLAHDCQQVEQLPIEPWDVAIDLILTPTQKIKPK